MNDPRIERQRNETVWKPRRFLQDDVTKQQTTIRPNPQTRLQGKFKHIPGLNFWRQAKLLEPGQDGEKSTFETELSQVHTANEKYFTWISSRDSQQKVSFELWNMTSKNENINELMNFI